MPDVSTPTSSTDLAAPWDALWAAWGLIPPDGLLTSLLARYAEPHRHYHATQHLAECLGHTGRIQAVAERPTEVLVALWFHDAIYDTQRQDNEALSANWARQALLDAGAEAALADRVHRLVMATQHRAEPVSLDEQVLVDVDLSILGATPERFAQYETQIKAEYAWVPEAIFSEKRCEVLASFLARPRLYATDTFRDLYEARARENLQQALHALA